jgi:hypothetical protein
LDLVLGKRLKNALPMITDCQAPYKKDLQGVAVECICKRYWLVDDGLQKKLKFSINMADNRSVSFDKKDR